jgi:hypothetical protein
VATKRYHLEFKLGTTPQGEWIVGAAIDGVVQSYRGPYDTKAKAEAGRDGWIAELRAMAEARGERLSADYDA